LNEVKEKEGEARYYQVHLASLQPPLAKEKLIDLLPIVGRAASEKTQLLLLTGGLYLAERSLLLMEFPTRQISEEAMSQGS